LRKNRLSVKRYAMIFQVPTESLIFLLPALIMSLTVHEYAHARTAMHFGDNTAKSLGRVTLNPLKHLDVLGTLALLLVGFGWAKPVPINPSYMRKRPFSEIMVSLAGPGSNLLLAMAAAITLRIINAFDASGSLEALTTAIFYLAAINIILCVFNLMPLYPLDGHHILRDLLPASKRISYQYWQIRYGMIILLVIVFGPELLGKMTGRHVLDPLGWVLQKAIYLIYFIGE